MKKIMKIFLVILLIPIIFITIISAPWLLMLGCSFLEPNPPKPEITYGEFPFKLEYSIDDEIFVVEDVIICEYDGIEWNEGSGKYRAWKETFKNTGEERLLILTDGKTKIYCNLGSGGYYMGDSMYPIREPHTPKLYYITSYDDTDIHVSGGAEELMEEYNIELIDWQLSEPIENKFE